MDASTAYYLGNPLALWDIKEPRYVSTDGCMGEELKYYTCSATHKLNGKVVMANGNTPKEAKDKLLAQLNK